MKFLLSSFILLMIMACGNNDQENKSSLDTQTLQPAVENKELQPPKPPSL